MNEPNQIKLHSITDIMRVFEIHRSDILFGSITNLIGSKNFVAFQNISLFNT